MSNKIPSNYPSQQLGRAVYSLATGQGEIRDRIHSAYTYSLINIDPSRGNGLIYKNHNEEITNRVICIIDKIEKHMTDDNRYNSMFINLLTTDESYEIAFEICELHEELRSE